MSDEELAKTLGDFNPRSPWGERLAFLIISDSRWYISIHAPRGGSDNTSYQRSVADMQFQSTLPVGGATLKIVFDETASFISIHAPRGGSDVILLLLEVTLMRFQSTLPVGGATRKLRRFVLS